MISTALLHRICPVFPFYSHYYILLLTLFRVDVTEGIPATKANACQEPTGTAPAAARRTTPTAAGGGAAAFVGVPAVGSNTENVEKCRDELTGDECKFLFGAFAKKMDNSVNQVTDFSTLTASLTVAEFVGLVGGTDGTATTPGRGTLLRPETTMREQACDADIPYRAPSNTANTRKEMVPRSISTKRSDP